MSQHPDNRPNCIEIIGDKIVRGIPYTPTLILKGGANIPIAGPFGDRLYFGVLPRNGGGKLATPQRREDVRSEPYFVYFEVPRLEFPDTPFSALEKFWMGGERYDRKPFWRKGENAKSKKGSRKDPYRAEIWLLRPYEALMLTDRKGNICKLHFPLGTPELVPATPEEVVQHLFYCGLSAEDHNTARWAKANIENVQELFLGHDFGVYIQKLQEIMDGIEVENRRKRLTAYSA